MINDCGGEFVCLQLARKIVVIIAGRSVQRTTFTLQTDDLVDFSVGIFDEITQNSVQLIFLNGVLELDESFLN